MEFIIVMVILFTIKMFCTYVSKVQQNFVNVAAQVKLRKGALIFPLVRVNTFMRKTEVAQKSSMSTQMREHCKLL